MKKNKQPKALPAPAPEQSLVHQPPNLPSAYPYPPAVIEKSHSANLLHQVAHQFGKLSHETVRRVAAAEEMLEHLNGLVTTLQRQIIATQHNNCHMCHLAPIQVRSVRSTAEGNYHLGLCLECAISIKTALGK